MLQPPSTGRLPAARSLGPLEWSLLGGLSVLWGGSFFFVEVAVAALPPLTLVALRVALAAAVLHAVLVGTGRGLPRHRSVWAAFFAMGLLNNAIPFSAIAWAQIHVASGLAAVLNATTPLFTIVVAHVATRDERLTPGRLGALAIGFAGVVVLVGADALGGVGTRTFAQLAVLGAAVAYACAGVFGRRFAALGVAPVAAAAGQLTASTVVLVPVALVVDRPWTLAAPAIETWAAMLGLALASTALAYVLYFRVLAAAGATNLLLVTFLIPVSAIALGTALLGERLAGHHGVGMALIGLGLAAIDGRPLRALRSAAARGWRRSATPRAVRVDGSCRGDR
jgi:drug/metabolite transporter (DMT)-like permease